MVVLVVVAGRAGVGIALVGLLLGCGFGMLLLMGVVVVLEVPFVVALEPPSGLVAEEAPLGQVFVAGLVA